MQGDIEQIAAIKSQTLAHMVEIIVRPDLIYQINGRSMGWSDYFLQLQRTLDWCNEKLRDAPTATMTTEDVSECLDLLTRMVAAYCSCEPQAVGGTSSTTYIAALQFLSRFGLLKIEEEDGSRVVGKFVDEETNP